MSAKGHSVGAGKAAMSNTGSRAQRRTAHRCARPPRFARAVFDPAKPEGKNVVATEALCVGMRRPRLLRRGALGTLQKAGLIGVQIIVAIARGPMLGGQIDTQLSMVRLGGGEMGSYAEAGLLM